MWFDLMWCVVWCGLTKPPETTTNHEKCAWAHVSWVCGLFWWFCTWWFHKHPFELRHWHFVLLLAIRDHYGYGLGQWEKALHNNAFSHWLSPCPEWSLGHHPLFHFLTVQQMTLTQGFEYFKRSLAQEHLKPPHTLKGLHLSQQSLPRKFPFVTKTILVLQQILYTTEALCNFDCISLWWWTSLNWSIPDTRRMAYVIMIIVDTLMSFFWHAS